ncbi:hypothetical protein CDA63_16530 [Hymenobacter amundsenii]|uniref:Uncharacterized protein n=1 Tax=Hymenobacter amundsenii TaxID=2006685 RepID=A0A246FHH6_9BACT|nr:hypothetical protein [Hymenobacter amundsenii]OWP61968.1 hypothetical protein CDA63_16530 [Hymenobacter amundsenii]
MKYRIDIGSPVDYEELVAYVIINGQQVALINQDKGSNAVMVELLDTHANGKGVEFDVLIEALQKAKKILLG